MTQPQGGPTPSGRVPVTPGARPGAGAPTPNPLLGSVRSSAGARGAWFGPYEVLDEVARGGGGVVLRARGPDGREAAIKVLRQSGDIAAERFARERALQSELGLAEGFVPLVAAGEGPTGPWLAMPFLPGGTLRDRLRRGPLPIDEAIDVGRRLAEALGRAHARGIVHRDLKPENVLFTAEGVPLVADLGLAKREGAPSGMSLSVTGEFRGTAGYMAPEQMKDAKTAGPPADVFSLGAILYECLTGEPAFAGDTVVAVIEHVDTGRVVPLAKRRPDTPPWLVQVVARCLARDVDERYEHGAALAAALMAGPAGPAGGRRLGRPHVGSLVLGLALGAAAGFAAGAAWRGGAAADPAAADVAPVATAPTVSPVIEPLVEPPVVDALPTVDPPAVVEEPPPPPPVGPPVVPGSVAAAHPGRASRVGPPLGGAAIDMDLSKLQPMELVTRWGSSRLRHTAGVNAISVARGADLMVSGDDHGLIRVWLRSTGQQRFAPLATPGGAVRQVAVSDDGQRVAYATGPGTLQVRELAADTTINLELEGKQTLAMAWAPGGTILVTTGEDRALRTWDLATHRQLGRTQFEFDLTAVAVSADGRRGVVGTATGGLLACDLELESGTWKHANFLNCGEQPVRRVAVSPDGGLAAGLIPGRGLVIWDVNRNEGTVYDDVLRAEAHDLAFAPDGVTVVAVDADSVVTFDCARRALVSQQRFPTSVRAACVAVGAPMRVAFSSVRGGGLAWVDVGAREMEAVISHSGWITSAVASGPTLYSCGADGTVRRWRDPDDVTILLDRDGWFHELELAAGGRLLTAAWSHTNRPLGGLIAVDVTTDQAALTAEGTVQVLSLALAGDGRRVLGANAPGTVDVIDLATASAETWRAHARSVRWVRCLQDGRVVTSGTEEAELRTLALWPPGGAVEPARRLRLSAHRALALMPGRGSTVVVGGNDGALSWWDLDAGREVRRVERAHAGAIGALAINPDGALGASGGTDRTLLLFDPRDGRVLGRVALTGSMDLVTSLRFDEQGLLVGLGTGVIVRLRPRG